MKVGLAVLTALFISISCSHNQATPEKPTESAYLQKSAFSLPDEDLQLLIQHSPQILKKINDPVPITIDDIISLQQLGFTSDMLILIINHTGSTFQLTTSDVLRLQAEGVPFKVINYMIRT